MVYMYLILRVSVVGGKGGISPQLRDKANSTHIIFTKLKIIAYNVSVIDANFGQHWSKVQSEMS